MAAAACLGWANLATPATAQQIVLQCDRAQTRAQFTLSATLHAVHGSFRLQQGEIRFHPVSGKISGEIVFDAASGETGNDGRDRKMHKDVLESGRYPQITFRPDRVDGKVAENGTSAVGVHGTLGIHGTEHEIVVPVEIRLEGDRWTATSHFPVPFVKWGLKNPSTLFLHVGDSVSVEFHGAGRVTSGAP
jgi:polyisoprenoid-binding protein YceI